MAADTVVLTFDDAVSNHATFVAPLLRSLGFQATFFLCEFPPDFAVNKRQYMTWEQIRELHAAGFELGNHTLTHAGVRELSEEEFERELLALEDRFRQLGLPPSVSFAYPGGPGSPAAEPVLRRHKFRCGRTVENERFWRPGHDNPYLLPATAVHGPGVERLKQVIDSTAPGEVPVLVSHGVPDELHPWVDTPPEAFREQMLLLKRSGIRVAALRELV